MYDEGDQPGVVPVSTGIPTLVIWTGVVGVLLAFVVAGMVLGTSFHGHMWPAENTLRLKL